MVDLDQTNECGPRAQSRRAIDNVPDQMQKVLTEDAVGAHSFPLIGPSISANGPTNSASSMFGRAASASPLRAR